MGICSGEGDNYNSILNPSSENKASGLKVSSKAKFECMGADKKKVFLRLTDLWGRPEIGCFASRTMRKLPQYMSLNPDPDCIATNALYQEWENFPFSSHVTKPTVFPDTSSYVHCKSNTFATISKPPTESSGGNTSFNREQCKARRIDTTKAYSAPWRINEFCVVKNNM